MNQQQFEDKHKKLWQEIEAGLSVMVKQKRGSQPDERLPEWMRSLTQQLAVARARGYSPALIDYLNQLNIQSYQLLYRKRSQLILPLLQFLVSGFPRIFRQYQLYFWISTLLFYGSGLLYFIVCRVWPESVYLLMDAGQVADLEGMYDPSQDKTGRTSETDLQMFGFYIYNNIGIAFRTFATGLIYCVGAIFTILFNGLFFGAVSGHLVNVGYHVTLFPFVIGHGAFELTAICIAGGCGLQIGWSIIAPGNLSRGQSLKTQASYAIKIMMGAGLMLFIAAFVEAFWSSSVELGDSVRYTVGAILWIFVILYLAFAGRGSASES